MKSLPPLQRRIDHTLLRPDASLHDIRALCREAVEYGFACVCVNPIWVATCAQILSNTDVGVCSVIGFPLGCVTTSIKAAEASEMVRAGAGELDMVINLGALKSGDDSLVLADIRSVVQSADREVLVKVILECGLCTQAEVVKACHLSEQAGARYVKTSTGFGPRGATVEDVALMRNTVKDRLGVKASGGIRTLETAEALLAAGASRLGTSASVQIITALNPKDGRG